MRPKGIRKSKEVSVRHIVFDIEGDGLLPELTVVHSLVLHDMETGMRMSCTDNSPEYYSMKEGLDVLANAEKVYGHNILGYDLPALRMIYPWWDTKATVLDTFTACQLRWAHIKDLDYDLYHQGKLPAKFVGRHSLEAWGWRLGMRKIEFEGPWDVWSPTMQGYCEQDVDVNVELVQKIRKSGVTKLSLDIEHRLRVYLLQQEENGWAFDLEAAQALYAKLSKIRTGLEGKLIERYGAWYEKDGHEVVPKKSRVMRKGKPAPEYYTEGCPYQKIKLVEFNPGSRAHIAKVLREEHGWVPTEFTDSGLPKVDETVLKRAKLPEADLLVDFLTVDKRIGQLAEGKQAWLLHATTESPSAKAVGSAMIHHQCWQNFARTHRAAHRKPNLAQVPRNTSAYGPACRSLFTVPPGWVMLGADASGLELRCMANRLNDPEYTRRLLESDIHIFNRGLLDFPETEEGRDNSKTFSYALIYGAGDAKLGSIPYPNAPDKKQRAAGKAMRRKYESKLPAYKRVNDDVKRQVQQHGYLRLIDGRRAYPRAQYSAFNTALQGDGAVICKLWIVTFADRLEARFGPQGWGRNWAAMGWIHDEVQLAVRPEIADEVGQIIVDSMAEVQETLKVNLRLDAEYKTGGNWSETH
jgi:hypothetical protein